MGPDVRLMHHRQSFTGVLVRIWCLVGDTFWTPWNQQFHIIPSSLAWIWLKTVDGLICLKCKNSVSVSVHGGVWSSPRCQPGRVSPPCEQVDDVWVWSSRQTPCRTLRRRAHGGRGCGDASSWLSYPWTSLCSPGEQRKCSTELTNSTAQVNKVYQRFFVSSYAKINVKCPQHFFCFL